MARTKIVSIAAAGNYLFAVDEEGNVWRLHHNDPEGGMNWKKIEPPQTYRGGGA